MNISKKDQIDLLTDQLKQMQNVLTLLQQEDNLVRYKTFVFYFIFNYFEMKIYYNIYFFLLRLTRLIHLKPPPLHL